MTIVAFTGHRPQHLYGYDKAAWERISQRLEEHLTSIDATEIITGGAQGFDQTAFWTANRMKQNGHSILNRLFIPFEGQDRPWKDTGLFGRSQFRIMLGKADDIVNCDDGCPSRTCQYFNRNHMMVDACDVLIALWDPAIDPNKTKGGTAECLRYALSKSIEIHYLVPDKDLSIVC